MAQPPGYHDTKTQKGKVCGLRKTLYASNSLGHEWYPQKLSTSGQAQVLQVEVDQAVFSDEVRAIDIIWACDDCTIQQIDHSCGKLQEESVKNDEIN